ncbi:MAG: hypothetical protein ABSA76_15250, partial [Bacteroidales bacterium]
MPELSLQDIDQISRDISRQEIIFSHLMEELIDHVCCDVEYEMHKGLNFSDAYQKVRDKIGPRGLKEIQEETLYAVDTKYRKMKNTMKISGIAGSVMLGFAAVFKIMHFHGASMMLTLGALLFAAVFIPSALVVLWKETHSGKKLFLFVSAFLTVVTFITGILCKIQHWPAAGILISVSVLVGSFLFLPPLLYSKLTDNESIKKRPVYITAYISLLIYLCGFWFLFIHWPFAGLLINIGLIMLLIIVLPWYTWLTWKEEKQVSAKFIFIVLTVLAFLMPGTIVNQNSLQKAYDEGFFIQMDQQQAMLNYREASEESFLNLYKDSLQHNRMARIHSNTMGLIGHINQLETQMVKIAEGKPGRPDENPPQLLVNSGKPVIQYRKLTDPFSYNPVKALLVPGTVSRKELDAVLAQYKDSLSLNISEGWIKNYELLLDPSSYLLDENSSLNNFGMISGLHALTLLKNGVLLSESDALRQIIK